MPDEIAETIAAEIVENVAEVAAEIIDDHNQTVEILEEINEALIDAALEKTDNQLRDEFEARVNSAVGEISERLSTCLTEVAQLQSEVTRLSTMATEAQLTAETSLILQTSNLQNEDEADHLNQTAEEVIEPESQQAPEEPPALQLRKRRTRLL